MGTITNGKMELSLIGSLAERFGSKFQIIFRMSFWMRLSSCRIICMEYSFLENNWNALNIRKIIRNRDGEVLGS